MPMFRKKPMPVEAREFTVENRDEVMAWCGSTRDALSRKSGVPGFCVPIFGVEKAINIAMLGDWIVQHGEDDFSPCRPDIFAATYEPVE